MSRLSLFAAAIALTASACVSSAPADPATAPVSAAPAPAADGTLVVGAFAEGGPALTVDDALARADALNGQTVRVAGTIRQVCQVRGCWLTFSTAQGALLRVVTHGEDEADRDDLTFPMDASGRAAEVVGRLTVTEESVERRRHLAEDAGASADEIAAITVPSRAVALVATGARLSPVR